MICLLFLSICVAMIFLPKLIFRLWLPCCLIVGMNCIQIDIVQFAISTTQFSPAVQPIALVVTCICLVVFPQILISTLLTAVVSIFCSCHSIKSPRQVSCSFSVKASATSMMRLNCASSLLFELSSLPASRRDESVIKSAVHS